MFVSRIEIDALGELNIPKDVLYGIHTERALNNFIISGLTQRKIFYKAMAQVKLAAAMTNLRLGYLTKPIGEALIESLTCLVAVTGPVGLAEGFATIEGGGVPGFAAGYTILSGA